MVEEDGPNLISNGSSVSIAVRLKWFSASVLNMSTYILLYIPNE